MALLLRLAFAAALADTYDGDEFVALALGHRFAQGAVPYRDFMFFHPPGMLVLLRPVDSLIQLWWPLARIGVMLLDALTATLVWRVGRELYGRRAAIGAGLLYAANPIVLLSAVRVLPDPLMTAPAMAGLTILLLYRSRRAAFVAGCLLGLAVWIKYPALLFVPVYALADRRRIPPALLGLTVALVILLSGFVASAHQMWMQTIVWQARGRVATDLAKRVGILAIFWLAPNVPALIALLRRRAPQPAWLILGFSLGGIFVLTPQVFYHYLVPIAPFGALVGGPLVAAFFHSGKRLALGGAAVAAGVCAVALIFHSPGAGLARGTRFSEARATIAILSTSPAHSSVLGDRFEYGFLAGRPTVPYFWNMSHVLDRRYILRHLHGVGAVVMSRYLGIATYPPGVTSYLDARYPRRTTPWTVVWICRR